MNRTEFHFPSATGSFEITAFTYTPEDGVFDTVLVIHHGMAEHQKRYEAFIETLCSSGIAVYMHDMASHGLSSRYDTPTGWFGEKNGCKGLVKDFREMVLRARRENPGKKLIVMGHSMGSFLCRLYTAWYAQDKVDGAIYMGTGGPNPAAAAGKAAAAAIAAVNGKTYKSPALAKMAFGSYGKKFEGRTIFDWLTRDTAIVDRYIDDPMCGFLFTVQGMHDLICANILCNEESWYRDLPKTLPILLVSGEMDPVGDYGKGVDAVYRKLVDTGHYKVMEKIYKSCRHEILNELNRETVMQDLIEWIRSV